MKEFSSIGAMVAYLATLAAAQNLALHRGLKKCAVAIEGTAKSEFGHYQGEVAPFAGWPELAESTKEDRVAKGFSENDPLLRTGKLQKSVSHQISGLTAVIGSDSEVMVYQELGTDKIPPRAVLGPAAIRNKKLVGKILGHAAAEGLLYGAGATLARLT
ncbi:hypothetical protein [Janthinobacterium sp. SUN137]|uniref:hypothetical protein n=1 Tax=Janthinobacterium sp. SUN137 TaxID=3014789 RepID=UPI002712B3E4|nr:hypothetical protein [Janthinobacterium sp. SUN137]MDO8039508.1 hypothetical protein [Janthinobacterium sp. SUN137]